MKNLLAGVTPISAFSAAALLLLAISSVAQETQPDQLSEVVVTAQRKEQSLQQVPISVAALTADALDQQGITGIESLVGKIPGLVIARELAAVVPFLRGVGQSAGQPGVEGSVSIYVDGVYMPSAAGGLFDFNNVDRIEVLKGPQGTLFGRNATGGIIQVVTRTPQHETDVEADVSYGNYNTFEGNVYATTGITENLAVDLAVHGKNQNDGFGHNINDGEPSYADWNYGLRGKVLYTPTDRITATFAGDFSRDRIDQSTAVVPGSIALDGLSHVGGFYDIRDLTNDYSRDTQWGVSAHVDIDLTAFKIVSISSYRNVYEPNKVDQDGTPLPIVNAYPLVARDKTVTQELQLQSSKDSAVDWIFGGFYMHDVAGYLPFNLGGFAVAPLDELVIQGRTTLNSFSGFAQATVNVLPATNLTMGARYTHDSRDIIGSTTGYVDSTALVLVPNTSQSTSFQKPTWRVSLDHHFASDVMAYASYNRGFKSGFYNVVTYANPAVKPETIDAYEVGLKTELFNHALRLNSAAYYYKLKQLQLPETENGATIFLNAASATIKGLEADFVSLPLSGLTVSGGVAYTHGRYTSFPNAPLFTPNPAGGNTLTSFDAEGQDTVHTPEWAANLNAAYTLNTPYGPFEPNITYTYTSSFCWYPDCRLPQKAYGLVNGSVRWSPPGARWSVELWAKNLLNKEYYRWAQEQTPDDEYLPGSPRTYGIRFHIKLR